MKLNYNEKLDKQNIRHFKEHGIFDRVERYHCVLCKRRVSLSGSSSNNGHKLICTECSYKYFAKQYSIDTLKRRKWMNEED